MKKILAFLLAAALSVTALAGCQSNNASPSSTDNTSSAENTEAKVITVGASPAPHAEILKIAAEILKDEGYELKVTEFSDYVQPNLALSQGELDANYFQHKTYLENFNKEYKTDLVSIGEIHYEPLGIYAGRTTSLDALADGATIAVPNDTTNEARALLLLQAQGLLEVDESAGLAATVKDITSNPKNIQIKEIEAAQLSRVLPDVDLAVINGNYAIDGGLKISDALAIESSDSVATTAYPNVVAVRKGDEDRPELQALVAALKSDKVKQYINDTFEGAVVPIDN